jgi:hypothetical protein
MFTDRSVDTCTKLNNAGYVAAYLSLTYQTALESKVLRLVPNWFTTETAFDVLATKMLYTIRTAFEHSELSMATLRSLWRREGSIHAELGFQLLRILQAPGNTFDSFDAFRVLLRRLIMRRDKGAGREGNAYHGAQQEPEAQRNVDSSNCEPRRRLSDYQIAIELDKGMARATRDLNDKSLSCQIDKLSISDIKCIDILSKVAPRSKHTVSADELLVAQPNGTAHVADGEKDDGSQDDERDLDDDSGEPDCDLGHDEDEDEDEDDDPGPDSDGDEGNSDDEANGRVRRYLPRRAKSSRVEINIGAAVASSRDELTVEARNELRLQGAVEEIRASIRADAEAESAPSSDGDSSDGVRRARILRMLQQVLAQANSHIRKQAAGREFRFNSHTLLCGNEAINGPLSFAVSDLVAVVCVSKHAGRVVHYADYGTILELTVASRRGTADHSRAKVINRSTQGAKFRLRFYSRVEKNDAVAKGRVGNDDTASRVAERGLLGHSYAVARMDGPDGTPSNDCCELLDRTDEAPQPQNRWDAGTLLCRVDVTPWRASPFVVVSIASQRRVDAIITALDLGASIDEAISAHRASPSS